MPESPGTYPFTELRDVVCVYCKTPAMRKKKALPDYCEIERWKRMKQCDPQVEMIKTKVFMERTKRIKGPKLVWRRGNLRLRYRCKGCGGTWFTMPCGRV